MKKWVSEFKEHFMNILGKSSKPCAIIALVILSVCCFAVFCGIIKPHITNIYKYTYVLAVEKPSEITKQEETNINYLLSRNRIIPVSTVYNNTLEYYDSLIAILVALLGVFAIASWISMRAKIKDDIQKEVASFFSTEQTKSWIDELIRAMIDEKRDLIISNIEDFKYSIIQQVTEQIESNKKDEIGGPKKR